MGLLQLDGVHATYGGQRVLGPLSLSIGEGEHIALVGRSGAGKSTLLRLLYEQGRRHTALIPQELGLVETLSVFHNVFMGRLADRSTWYNLANLVRPFPREVAAVREVLEPLAMADKIWSPAGELSGGQRQRTAVARALYQQAPVLLADEPVSALDGPQAHRVMQALMAQHGTVVVALHDIELALQYTHRIVGIREGVIALDKTASGLTEADLQPLY